MHSFKIKYPFLFLLSVLVVSLLVNSCKKQNNDLNSLKQYLSSGAGKGVWELASLQVTHFKRNTPSKTDTLNYACGSNTQNFVFAPGGTCTYQYFQCNSGPYNGSWTLDSDSLVLHATMLMPDTASKTTGTSHPFANAHIANLGANSLILLTGDTKSYYPDNNTHAVYRYSFIHPQVQ